MEAMDDDDADGVELEELQFRRHHHHHHYSHHYHHRHAVDRSTGSIQQQDALDADDDDDEDDDDEDEDDEAARRMGYRRKRRRRRRRKSVPLCPAASAALDQSALAAHAAHAHLRHGVLGVHGVHAPRRPHGLRESLLTVLGKLVVWRHGGATQYRQTLGHGHGHGPPEYLRGFIPIGTGPSLPGSRAAMGLAAPRSHVMVVAPSPGPACLLRFKPGCGLLSANRTLPGLCQSCLVDFVVTCALLRTACVLFGSMSMKYVRSL